ncbi:MAG: dienelactone hydrolase family protein [Bryobacterales bacterium]|nr:dienelactone hydrolase family protein [Bryobacterales bacterium]
MAAAFDDRIGAVIVSSGNTGESTPWRFTPDMFVNETIEEITGHFPHWFHPRLRFFAGREHKLPIDQNSIMSLVAPRGLMIVSAYSEGQGAPFGIEQGYRSVKSVYRFLGAEEKLAIWLRPGEHPTTAGDIERYVDFFDHVFARPHGQRPEELALDFEWDRWRQLSGEAKAVNPFLSASAVRLNPSRWSEQSSEARRNLVSLLGEEPGGLPFVMPPGGKLGMVPSDGWLAAVYNRPLRGPSFRYIPVGFGDDLHADLYLPASAAAGSRLPLLIWLHPYSHPTGYSRGFRPWLEAILSRGFAVMAFDQLGYGVRVLDARRFYDRYPRWSMMGKMVADTRAAIAAVKWLEGVDPERVYLAGWALGARVSLYTAALDPTVKGVALIAGIWPQRANGDARTQAELAETEGLTHWSTLHGLLPQLAAFRDKPDALPLDDTEVLALLAPRRVLLVSPTRDRYASLRAIERTAGQVREVYRNQGAESAFDFRQPLDYNRFQAKTKGIVLEWLSSL